MSPARGPDPIRLTVPELSLVLLVGASGCGKSTFARRFFQPTEVISSDRCRGWVADDETDPEATRDAFDIVHAIAAKRLARRRLTVIDATNVQPQARKPLVELARRYHALAVAIVFDLPESLCRERNRGRSDRRIPRHAVHHQTRDLRRSVGGLKREGFRYVHRLRSVEEVENVEIDRPRPWTDRRDDRGPFDVIGDVHGCFDELAELLLKLGWELQERDGKIVDARHPEDRRAIFLGDLVDRGPASADVLRLVMGMVGDGTALCLPGNHDVKILRWLQGRKVRLAHGRARTIEELEAETPEFRHRVREFLDGLVSHYVLDGGRLVVAHAGMRQDLQGRASGAVRSFALYGDTTGETDELGLPVRRDWAADYRGDAAVVYGHVAVLEAEWRNNTLCIDTGCVFGGKLTALRYPERQLVEVPAARLYHEPPRPLAPPARTDDLLDLEDVRGKRVVKTRLRGNVTLRQEETAAALEVMSRFAVDPRWLVYLPPTMAPPATRPDGDLLEHPDQVFAEYARSGIERLVCEEKHMGSRAVAIVCRDGEVAGERFGVSGEETGVCFTRTGRRFFADPTLETEFLARLRRALDAIDFWRRFDTGWVCLDCELMPWSAKAQELLLRQYAPIGAAGGRTLAMAEALLSQTETRGVDLDGLRQGCQARRACVERYVEAYRRYCWPVDSLTDLKLAPFHLLATEGRVHSDRTHRWHLDRLDELCAADPELLLATASREVDLDDPGSRRSAVDWWLELTAEGGEGMVVKPLDFLARGKKGLVQPAIKCRGREYLRIIYGPEYTAPEHLERLRQRSLGHKRSLALRELALGLEALERFAARRPLAEVHECVFGVLALESEPVDPRL